MASQKVLMLLGSIFSVAAQLHSETPKNIGRNYTPKIPENFCVECIIDLATVDPITGAFYKPRDIYKLDTDPRTGCLEMVKKYVQLNGDGDKDTKDAYNMFIQTKDITSPEYERLERIVYSYCELCCDCIDAVEPANKLIIDIYRPNCLLHDYYDISNLGIFPDAKYQNYTTGEIIGDKIFPDLDLWFKCKPSSQQTIRSGLGVESYLKDSPCLSADETTPTETSDVDDRRRLLGDRQLNEAQEEALDMSTYVSNRIQGSSRKLAQIDCEQDAVKAAMNRVYNNIEALVDHVGCASRDSYYACHEMEYRQGKVCGTQCGPGVDCEPKSW